MGSMFQAAKSFNQNLSGWDVDHVDDLKKMFYNAESFDQNLGGWATGSGVTFKLMFSGADCLEDVSHNKDEALIRTHAWGRLGSTMDQ